MIRTIKTILIILALATVAAAVPSNINYQGVLRDSAGNLVTGNRSMVFTLYDAASGGSSLWTVTSSEVAVSNGLYTIQLSGITSSVLGSGDRWLEVAIAGTTLTPRLKIASVAYAITAGSAESAVTLAGYSAAATGNSIIPVTDGTGKLNTAVIPDAGINVSHASTADYATNSGTATNAASATSADAADYATVSGTATNAGTVDNFDASATATAGDLLALDSSKRFSDIAVSVEATGTNAALNIVDGKLNALFVDGNGTVGTPVRAVCGKGSIVGAAQTVYNELVTTNSVIILTPIFPGTGASYSSEWIKVDSVSNGSFIVEIVDGTAPTAAIDFFYLVIN